MAITVMNRCEQKYFITEDLYDELMKKIESKLEKDKYFKETIYNIYFDNENNELIYKSISKPIYKEKIRLRSYEVPKSNMVVFLEIKKKYKDITNKRRIALEYSDLINYLDNGIMPNTNKQILSEIDYCFKRYNLKPVINITYDRLAYKLKEDSNFRITFDNNIRYSLDELKLSKLDDKNILFNSGYIMEVKSLNGLPIWFNKILTELKIYPTSYSKINKIYAKIGGVYV